MNFSAVGSQFWTLLISGAAVGFLYVLISLGYTMVYGVLRLINFANSEIFMIGTFANTIMMVNVLKLTKTHAETFVSPVTHAKVVDQVSYLHGMKLIGVFALCIVVSMLASGITAVLVEIVAYRRLRAKGTNRLASLISAI
jgi:branched-chain amino acid transport system permease protein